MNEFVSSMVMQIIPGASAKDKVVRFRACQLLSILVQYLGEIEYILYLFHIKIDGVVLLFLMRLNKSYLVVCWIKKKTFVSMLQSLFVESR